MARQCPKAQACGGCAYNGVKYSQQLEIKQKLVNDLIGPFCPVAPIYAMEDPFYYRNKVQSVFGISRSGQTVSGIYRKGTHNLIPVSTCMIEDRMADHILQTVRTLVRRFGIMPYDEDSRKGFLRHVLIRISRSTGQAMVVLVASAFRFPQEKGFVKALLEAEPSVTTVLINKNGEKTSMVLSDLPERILYGSGYIEDVLCNLRFRISAKSFWQVNSVQAQRMFNAAMRMVRFKGNEHVIDAYCGTGAIGLIAASRAASVTGIELNPSAVEDAKINAKINGIENASFICGDASDVIKDMASEHVPCDVLFLDPPRSGSTEKFLAAAMRLAPKTIIYISCNPETLARDLRYIASRGMYRALGAQPVDMFPQTGHVETVCLLSKLSEAKHHISVQVDMDELDLTAAESKATYEEIQACVQEKYGFHVTHLNTAKTKRKCGIIERQNYNLPKNKDSRSPETPKEKEEAIIEAFKAFQMI